jgi:spectinomycin phosphotransferase
VRDKPAGVGEDELREALVSGWRIHAASTRYAAVGGGSYHWVVRDGDGEPLFVTVDDLDDKPWLGQTRAVVFDGLRTAMDTALALRHQAGLRFVTAPIPALDGTTVRPLDPRYAIAVFPFLSGISGRFGEDRGAAERGEVAGLLAALHNSTPAVAQASVRAIALPGRGRLEAALRELGQPWPGGPFSEPARALLTRAAGQVHDLLRAFDQLAARVTAAARPPVITHGEPHPGNIIRMGTRRMLVDWDTAGLAPPERDLWMVASGEGEELRRYTDATGRTADPAALTMYRLRWALDDISSFVTRLRAAHHRTADAEHAWQALQDTISVSGGSTTARSD